MLNDTTSYLQCENEDYTLLYMAIIVMTSSSIAIVTLMSFVVWIAKRQKKILQTPQRLWLRPLDLLMGNQVHMWNLGLASNSHYKGKIWTFGTKMGLFRDHLGPFLVNCPTR